MGIIRINRPKWSSLCPREESNLDYKIRNLASYPLNDEGNARIVLKPEDFFNCVDERRLMLNLFQYRFQAFPKLIDPIRRREYLERRLYARTKIKECLGPFAAQSLNTPALELFEAVEFPLVDQRSRNRRA